MTKKIQRILGIDLSLRNTGLVLLDISGTVIKSETVATDKSMSWITCINKIENTLADYLHEADAVFMENYSFGSSHGRELAGEIGGVVKKLIADTTGELPTLIAPTTLKLFATGRGQVPKCPEGEVKSNWGKKWLMQEVKQHFDMEFDTDHETDAFVVATIGRILHLITAGILEMDSLPKHQQKVMNTLIKEEVRYG